MTDLQKQVDHIADNLRTLEFADCEWENGEPCAGEYSEDVLDVEYYVGSDGSYRGVRLLVTFGGPNIWIDTKLKEVQGFWWGDKATAELVDNLGLDDFWSEMWDCQRVVSDMRGQ